MMRTFSCFALLLALSFPACSRFSESARKQRAYEKYVRKSSITRTRQQAKFSRSRAPKIPSTQPTEPETNVQESPQEPSGQ